VEIIDTFWFSGETQMGIVIIKNQIGELKAYLGTASGADEKTDSEYIADNGVRLHKETLESIIKKLEGK